MRVCEVDARTWSLCVEVVRCVTSTGMKVNSSLLYSRLHRGDITRVSHRENVNFADHLKEFTLSYASLVVIANWVLHTSLAKVCSFLRVQGFDKCVKLLKLILLLIHYLLSCDFLPSMCILSCDTMWLPIFPQDKFLPFIDLFQKENVKVEVCKTVIKAFILYVRSCDHLRGSVMSYCWSCDL